ERVPGAQRAWREGLYHGFELLGLAMRHPRAMRRLQRVGEAHLRRQIPDDPELRATLTPDYTLGCKRILMSNDFYASLTQPNVEVVPSAVTQVTRTRSSAPTASNARSTPSSSEPASTSSTCRSPSSSAVVTAAPSPRSGRAARAPTSARPSPA